MGLVERAARLIVLLSLALSLLSLARTVYLLPQTVDAAIAREGRLTRDAVVKAMDNLSSRVDMAVARADSRLTEALVKAVDGVRSDVNRQMSAAFALIDERTDRIPLLTSQAQRSLEETGAQLGELLSGATQAVASANELLEHTDRAVTMITPQVLGSAAAIKVLAGEAATTARTWRRETPAIAANVRETTENVKRASDLSKWQKLLLLGAAVLAAVSAVR